MAAVAKTTTPSPASLLIDAASKVTGLVAGEALTAGDAGYIKSDGKVWLSTGAAANAAAKVRGFVAVATPVGEAATLIHGSVWRYGAGLTPGADLFLSAVTPGALSDVATVGGTGPIGYVIDATRVYLDESKY